MHTPTRSLRFSSLRSVQNARTRIFVVGSDPVFRTARPWATASRIGNDFDRLWDPRVVDLLTPRLTRYHD